MKNRQLFPLVGTWQLLSFELRMEDGTLYYPWGKDVQGQVIYGQDGYMAGSLMQKGRVHFNSKDVMGGTPDEFATAMKSYISYCGPYSYDPDHHFVIHHADISLFPNWTGTDIKRFVEIQNNEILTLSTPPILFEGKESTANLIWKRAPIIAKFR